MSVANVQKGDWANNSAYIRVAMDSNVDAGMANPSLLPFGYRGIVKYDDEELTTGSAADGNWVTGSIDAISYPDIIPATAQWTSGSVFAVLDPTAGAAFNASNAIGIKVLYPTPELRVSASDGNLSNKTDAYFGFQTAQSAGSTVFDKSTIDLLRPRGGIVGTMFAASTGTKTERSLLFTLDDVSGSSGVWVSGSHNKAIGGYAGGSLTRADGAVSGVLDAGFDRFSVPLYGGFDGVNITEMDPFTSATRVMPTTATDQTSYVFNTYRRTIDAISDPEVIEMNLASIPGLRNEGLTTNLVNVCEDRADALAIIRSC